MAVQDSDGEGDFVSYGKPLELYEEGKKKAKDAPAVCEGAVKRFIGAKRKSGYDMAALIQ